MGRDDTVDAYVLRRLVPYLAKADQGAVAKAVGVRQQQISDYKRGQWKRPPLGVLDRMAKQFGLTLSGILAELPLEDPRPEWQQALYAAVGSVATEVGAEQVTWLARRLAGEPAGSASSGSPSGGQKSSSGQSRRARRATA